jgi:hypothetical protein
MLSVREALPDQTITFHYTGKERSGYRLVKVRSQTQAETTGNTNMTGWDIREQDFRTFTHTKCSNPRLVADVGEEVVLPDFVKGDHPPEKLIAVYKTLYPEVFGVKWDNLSQVLVVRHRYEPQCSITVEGLMATIAFRNIFGKGLALTFKISGGLTFPQQAIQCKLTESEAKKFATELFDHFNYDLSPGRLGQGGEITITKPAKLTMESGEPTWREMKNEPVQNHS